MLATVLILELPVQVYRLVKNKSTFNQSRQWVTIILKSLSLGFFILYINFSAFAQSVCSQTLSSAQGDFDAGHMYGIPSKLKDCIDGGLTKQERIQAYKLLTITYLYIDDPISAENSYLNLLRLDPEHVLDPNIDPVELIYLSRKFTTAPHFTLNLARAGINFSKPTIIHNNGVDNTANSAEEYKIGFGFQFGTGADLNLNEHFALSAEFNFGQSSFEYRNTLFNFDIQNVNEKHTWIQIPAFFKYTFEVKKFYPFVYAGYSYNLLLSAKSEIQLLDRTQSATDPTSFNIDPVTGPEINIKKARENFNSSLVFGAGFRYRIKYQYISFDVRVNGGLTNLLDQDKQFELTDPDINELRFRYGYVEDDVRLNSISISIGYVKPLYFPRKIEKGPILDRIKNLFKKRDDR